MKKNIKNDVPAILGASPIRSAPFPPYHSIGKEEVRAALRVLKSGELSGFIGRAGERFCGGRAVKEFEKVFERRFQVRHAVSFNSATTALQAALAAAGVGPGDEVITTPYTMCATATSILINNAVPVFADIDEHTLCIDPADVERKITKKTKSILAVHLFGRAADMSALKRLARKYRLILIEDNAQSIGAKYKGKYLGTVGDVGVFSFNANKTLQCGEGGMLATNNGHFAFRAELVRNHGEAVIDDMIRDRIGGFEAILGNNFRLTEIQAAIATEQLKKIKKLTCPRVSHANKITRALADIHWLTLPPVADSMDDCVFFMYPLRFHEEKVGFSRKVFAEAMAAEGYPVSEGYVKPLYLLPLYQQRRVFPRSGYPFELNGSSSRHRYEKGLCPIAECMYERELVLTDIVNSNRSSSDIDGFIQAVVKIDAHREKVAAREQSRTNGAKRRQTIIAVIQSRMSSTRFPGKALQPICGKTSIEWIKNRLSFSKEIDAVVLATSDRKEDDILEKHGKAIGLPVFRGSETDLISRHLGAAKRFGADAIVRITADCPFVDPTIVDTLVGAYRRNPTAHDYISNVRPATLPKGFDCELLPMTTLVRLNKEVRDCTYRELITVNIWNNPKDFRTRNIAYHPDFSREFRVTFDYPEDHEVLERICRRLQQDGAVFGASNMIQLYHDEPELFSANKKYIAL